MPDLPDTSLPEISRTALAKRADALRAVKYQPPLAEDSSYGAAYIQGLTALAGELFAALGTDLDAIADTLRAAGIAGDAADPERNTVSIWLRHLLGPGYYAYSLYGYAVDLDVPGGETEDPEAVPVPGLVAEFLSLHEDPDQDELDRYRGITLAPDGRAELYLCPAETWVCAAVHPDDAARICGAPTRPEPCPRHPHAS
jgi:hypothetical protein